MSSFFNFLFALASAVYLLWQYEVGNSEIVNTKINATFIFGVFLVITVFFVLRKTAQCQNKDDNLNAVNVATGLFRGLNVSRSLDWFGGKIWGGYQIKSH